MIMTHKSVTSKFTAGVIKRLTLLVAMLSLFVATGSSQNYPFPQNYQYPYGEIYTSSSVQTKIQGLYNTWKATYYTEGTIGGTPCARIKFQQPGQDGTATVSEGIAYGMLIFVYMDNATNNTQDEFNRLWAYYQKNSDYQGFMNWKVNAFTGTVAAGSGNEHGATDADIDVANSLLMAHKQWGSNGAVDYLSAAKTLIDNIYQYEVDGNKLLKPGNAFNDYANPCYYITNSTELFGIVEVDQGWKTSNRWSAVTSACYSLMAASKNTSTGLVPDWCQTPGGGAISGIVSDKFESYFLYDAVRIPWRMAHAYAWYGHSEAKTIASDITSWASTKYPNPADIVDGYLLNGNVFNNPDNNANFSSLGTSKNPCFQGGLSIGSMVDPGYSNYMDKCWNVGSATDGYGAYYTHTTQILYMLTLTGNMPNFWDMKPVPETAETNSNGNVVIVDFSKTLASTTSVTGWSIQTYADEADATATLVGVSSISISGSTVSLTLTSDIAEPIITVSYNGTTIKSSGDNLLADAIDEFPVTNKITSMEPFPDLRFTDVVGLNVKVQWSKEIDPSSIVAGDFTVKVNGTPVTVLGATLDSEDNTITNIEIAGGSISTSADIITLSFAGGSITGTSSVRTAKAFTDKPVQNFYMSVNCYTISDFDLNTNLALVAGWAGAVDWDPAALDPDDGTNKVAQFAGTGTEWGCVRAAFLDNTDFYNAMNTSGAVLKGRIYLNANPDSEGIEIHLMHSTLYDYDANARIITIPASALVQGGWYDFEGTIQTPADADYDAVMIRGTKASPGSTIDFYIDDLSICPPAPTVSFVNGKVSYDGSEVEIRFSTGMKVPTSLTAVTIKEGLTVHAVSSIASKQGDATTLVFTLETPISSATATVTATAGTTLKAVDGRSNLAFTNKKLANLFGITVTTGWRDDFASATDYVTANVGVPTTFTMTETVSGDGYLSVAMDGSDGYNGVSVMTYVDEIGAAKEVMDLTNREIVQFRYRINGTVPPTLKLRIDVKDLVNGLAGDYASDGMAWTTLTPSTTWQEVTIDLKPTLFNQYSFAPTVVDIDRTNIYQVLMYFITAEATGAPWDPTVFDGTIEFDYISIGSALYLSNVTETVIENGDINATSSADGQIFIVPQGTTPMLSALQEAVFDGLGVVADVSADVQATITLTNLRAGYYEAYAYDPSAGALSAKVGIDVKDVTAPIITDYTSGEYGLTATISATVNEDAVLYLLPATGVDYTSIADIIGNAYYSQAVAQDVATAIALADVSGLSVGDELKLVAVDYATPTQNLSSATIDNIIIANAALTMTVTPTGTDIGVGTDITVTVNRAATAYLIPATENITDASQLDAVDVSKIAIASASGVVSTTGLPEGEYYVYVSDGTDFVGPSSKITLKILIQPVTDLAFSPATVNVDKDASKTTEVLFTPSVNISTDLSLSFDNTVIDATYDAATGFITITGVDVTTVGIPTSIVVTSEPDQVVGTILVNVTCPTATPTSLEVPAVSTCVASPDPLVATFASPTAEAVWYASDIATTPLATGNTFAHGLSTASISTFYVAQNDGGCESSTRLAVDLTINTNPVPSITGLSAAYCNSNVTAITLVGAPTGGVFTIDGGAPVTKLNPSTLAEGAHSVEYVVTAGTCEGSTSESIQVDAPATISITGVTTDMCSADSPQTLSATPTGGTWSGDGVTASSFNPADASIGANIVTYEVVSGACTTTADETITVAASPSPTFSGLPASVCIGSAAIDLSAAVSVAGGAFTDNLGNVVVDEFIPTVAGTSTIDYDVTIGSCSGTAQAAVLVNDLTPVTVTPVAPLCTNGNIETLVASPSTGTWSGSTAISGSTFDPTLVSSGTYDITYEYIDPTTSCKTTEQLAIEVNTAAIPTAADVSVELNATVTTLTASALGTITWYKSDQITPITTGDTYSPSVATDVEGTEYTYYVSNTENGCESALIPVKLIVTSCLTAAPTSPSSELVCFGETNPALTATGTALKWYDATGTTELGTGASFTPTATTVGVHTFKVSQTLGCEGAKATATLQIESKPNTLTVAPVEVCEGATLTALSATGTMVKWYDENKLELDQASTYTPVVSAADTYTYYATQTVGNCTSDFASATYKVIAKPDAPVIADASACLGSAYSITATGSNIKWFDQANTQIGVGATLAPTGISIANTYTYSANQTVGACVSDKATGTLTVYGLPTVTLDGITTVCSNDALVSLTGAPSNGTYSGVGLDANNDFIPSPSLIGDNLITYSYTDSHNCSAEAQLTITVNHAETPTVTGNSCLVNDAVPALGATATGTATWFDALGGTSIATGVSYTPTVSTAAEAEYTYYVSNNDNGCFSDSVPVILTVSSCGIAAPAVTATQVCAGDAAGTLTATGTSITWYDNNDVQVGTGATYQPTNTNAGVYTYYATQTIGCESSKQPVTYTVNALPSVSFSTIAPLCFSDAAVTLSSYVTPATGTFTGTGVANGKLTPSESIAGPVTVSYSYTDAKNCVTKVDKVVTINFTAPPVITTTPIVTQVDVTPDPFQATGTDILWYSDATLISNIGSGVTYQAASKSSEGQTTFYATQEENNCVSDPAEAVLSVTNCSTGLPTVTSAESCVGEAIQALSASGINLTWYSDVALTTPIPAATTTYTPAIPNTTATVKTYYVTQTDGCQGSAAPVTYTVKAAPVVTFDAPASQICNDDATVFDLTSLVNITGGVFSGDMTSSSFTPSVIGQGGYDVIYTYTNPTTNCANSASQLIVVDNCGAPATESITINTSISLGVGETKQLTLQVAPLGASNIVSWEIDDPYVTISSAGVIEGVSAGTTKIRAKATDNSGIISLDCNVTVSAVFDDINSVSLDATVPTTVEENNTIDLSSHIVLDPLGTQTKSITYTSLDPSVATVDPVTGVVTALAVPFDKTAKINIVVVDMNDNTVSTSITLDVTKKKALITNISIPTSVDVEETKSRSFLPSEVVILPSNADNKDLTWSIVSGTGGTIDPSTGAITATGSAPSQFVIMATAQDAGGVTSNQCVVNIVPLKIPVSTISVDIPQISITKNGTQDVIITFNPTNTTETDLTIDVGTSGIVAVTKISPTQYRVEGLKGGSQQIIFRSSDNSSVFASTTVTVTELVESITVTSVGSVSTLNIGSTLQLSAQVLQSSATDKTYTWESSNTSIATVSPSGVVTALAEGAVIIKAKANDASNVEGQISLLITKIPVTGIDVDNLEVEVGLSAKINYTVYPLNATNSGVTFSVNDNSIAEVDALGNVTGVNAGAGSQTAIVTVTSIDDPTISQDVTITVVPRKADKSGLISLDNHGYIVYEKVNVTKEIEVGTGLGQVPPLNYNLFLTAWGNAEDVIYDPSATQEEVDYAYDVLYDAITGMDYVIEDDVAIGDVATADVKVYPTIISDVVTVSASNIELVKVVSSNGTIIEVIQGDLADVVEINTSELSQGIYFIYVYSSNEISVKQVLK